MEKSLQLKYDKFKVHVEGLVRDEHFNLKGLSTSFYLILTSKRLFLAHRTKGFSGSFSKCKIGTPYKHMNKSKEIMSFVFYEEKLEVFSGHLLREDNHSHWAPQYWTIMKEPFSFGTTVLLIVLEMFKEIKSYNLKNNSSFSV